MLAAASPTRLAAALAALAVLAGCPADPPPKKEPACTAEKACKDGLVCEVDPKDATKNACVPCKRDRECTRNEFCHPLDRRCRLRPCYGEECTVHDDCALGQFCVQGKCLRSDETTEEGCTVQSCADGQPCNEDQRCHPVNDVCEENLGCTEDSHCAPTEKCNVAAGRCELACTAENAIEVCGVRRVCTQGRCVDCTKDEECGGGLKCNTTTNVCESLTSCSTNADCEIPLVCNRLTRECTSQPPPCLSAEDCAQDETCQLSTGRCVPAACVADRFEPNDALGDSRALAVGSTPNLTLCTDDADYFKVPLAAGDRLQAVVDVDPLLNFEVSILNGAGEVVARGDYEANGTVAVGGDYFVRSRSRDQYVRYGLRLSVSRGLPCDTDVEEPNDDYLHADELGPGDYYRKSLCPRDEDWFVVGVQRGQTLEVELVSTPADGDLDLVVYDSNGTKELGRSATSAEVEAVTTSAFTGSRVYVRVVGGSTSVQNVYDLLVRLRGP